MVKKRHKKKTAPEVAPVPAVIPPAPSRWSVFRPAVWISPFLFALATWFLFKQDFKWVGWLLAAEVFWQILYARVHRVIGIGEGGSGTRPGLLAAWFACFSMLALAVGTFYSFRWIIPKLPELNPASMQWILVFLLVRLAFAFKAFPPLAWKPDISPLFSRILLFLLLLGGAWLRLHRLGDIPGTYWDDCAGDIFSARSKVDFGYFAFILSAGTEEPFFQYLAGFLAFLLPDISSMVLHKLTLIVIGMVSLWVFYLLGKEAGGRRVGLVMLGFGAVSKAFIMLSNQILLHFNTLTLSTSLALLFFIRLYKKPTPMHFLQWGAAVAFGVYTYVAFRALLPILVFVPLFWVLSDKRERDGMKPGEWMFAFAAVVSCALFCFYGLNFWKYPTQFSYILKESGFFFPGLILVVCLPALYRFWAAAFPGGRHPKMTGYVVGSLQFMLLSASVLWHPAILGRLASLDMFAGMTFAQKLARVGQQVQALVYFLFYGSGAMWNDAFFGYPSALLVLCGVAYSVGRPKWIRFWLLLLSFAGVGTFLLSGDAHSGKVLACAVPLYLLGSMGVVRLWDALGSAWPAFRSGVVTVFVFLAVLGASGSISYVRVYHHWMDGHQDRNTIAVKQARKDAAEGRRVYIANSADYPSYITTMAAANVLLEGSGVGTLHKQNVIDLGPDEKGPDVVVVFAPDQAAAMKALADAHRGSQVTDVGGVSDMKNLLDIKRLVIPFASLGKGRKPAFKVRRAAPNEWVRIYYYRFSLARGSVLSQDRSADLNAPHLPTVQNDSYAARFIGGLQVDQPGQYRMNYNSGLAAIVKVDGRKILTDGPLFRKARVTRSTTLKLEAGRHRVEIICDLWGAGRPGLIPVLEFRPASQPQSPPLPMGGPPPGRIEG